MVIMLYRLLLNYIYRALELALKHNMLVEAVLKTRKEYLSDLKIQSENIPLFTETEKKFGSSIKKKTKVVTKKRDKSGLAPAPTLDLEDGSGDFSLQPNPSSFSMKTEKEPSIPSLGNNEEAEAEELKRLEEQFVASTAQKSRNNDVPNDNRPKNASELEKELDVDVEDFY